MCIIGGCSISKSYNFFGLKPEYCKNHKLDGMINTKHQVCNECNTQASYGFLHDNLRIKCGNHKTDNMINLKSKNINCLDSYCINNFVRCDKYCSIKCKLSNTSLNDTTHNDLNNVSIKEYLLFRFLQQNFISNKIYWDKQIKGTLYRPDFRMDFKTFQILIENDENQHKFYNKCTGIERLDEIYKCLNIPLYIIRFNPDKYINNNGVVNGCFSNNSVSNPTDWNYRLNKLKDTINECGSSGICEKYEISYLFYNMI